MSLTRQEKVRARNKARWAFPVVAKCERCPATERLERHHPDHAEPLAVVILCKPCHIEEHARAGGYYRLAAQLREGIRSGEYRYTIPSIVQLQRQTGFAVVTIRSAFRLLADEGYVLRVPGKGTYVNPREMWPDE